MKSPMCPVCGLSEPLSGSPFCHDCAAIRDHKFTDHTIFVVDGSWHPDHPMIGGAGIVLVEGSPTGKITGQRYCGFSCRGSQEAEYEAILRARRWTPTAMIYSDAKAIVEQIQDYQPICQVRFLHRIPELRGSVYRRAHRLSVQGRQALVNCEAREQTDPKTTVPAAERLVSPRDTPGELPPSDTDSHGTPPVL